MRQMTPREAHDAWRRGELHIVDVREESEHLATHVPGVPLVPMSQILDRVDEVPHDRPLAIMCRSEIIWRSGYDEPSSTDTSRRC